MKRLCSPSDINADNNYFYTTDEGEIQELIYIIKMMLKNLCRNIWE